MQGGPLPEAFILWIVLNDLPTTSLSSSIVSRSRSRGRVRACCSTSCCPGVNSMWRLGGFEWRRIELNGNRLLGGFWQDGLGSYAQLLAESHLHQGVAPPCPNLLDVW